MNYYKDTNIMMTGDLNCPAINWDSVTAFTNITITKFKRKFLR